MKALVTALAFATLASSASLAAAPHHYRRSATEHASLPYYRPARLVPLLVAPWQKHRSAGTTWHDDARYREPPHPTGTWARSQDGERYQRVESDDVVLNGAIVGRDPDPNIRFQLLREAGFPSP